MKSPALCVAVIYLCIMTLIAVAVTVIDKIKASRGKWRIPEKTLLILAALGGSVGMYVAMLTVRHKTKHIKFMAGIPIILLFQLVAICWIVHRLGGW